MEKYAGGIRHLFGTAFWLQGTEYFLKQIYFVFESRLWVIRHILRDIETFTEIPGFFTVEVYPVDRPRLPFATSVSMGHALWNDKELIFCNF